MKILVDADACPVKDEIERIAAKRNVEVLHVCAHESMKRSSPGTNVVYVSQGPDAADEWILEHCGPDSIVITQDVPLASRAVNLGAAVVDIRGQELHQENMPDRLQMRDLVTSLRDRGEPTRGPRPFSKQARREFANTFARVLDRLLRNKQN